MAEFFVLYQGQWQTPDELPFWAEHRPADDLIPPGDQLSVRMANVATTWLTSGYNAVAFRVDEHGATLWAATI